MKININNISKKLIDEKENKKIVALSTYSVLGFISLVMTIMNIVTDKGWLTFCTGVFAALCVVNIILVLVGKNAGARIALALFSAEFFALFSFFLISGNPEGFSAIWICMLPSLGMFFFGRGKGSVFCGIMFIELVILLWTPFGNGLLMYSYTDSFKMRFPVLFVAFHLLALFLETLRLHTYHEVLNLQNQYETLAEHDPLTGMLNRQGMYSMLDKRSNETPYKKIGTVIFDIDFFKEANDVHGHAAGDAILKELAHLFKQNFDSAVTRWGGEEFIIVYFDGEVSREKLEDFRSFIENHTFVYNEIEIRITLSMGVCEDDKYSVKEIDKLINNADVALYRAKETGRNKVVYYSDMTESV